MRAAKSSFLLTASFFYTCKVRMCSVALLDHAQRGWRQTSHGTTASAAGAASTISADISYATRRPMFVLYGDSITQFGFDSPNGWAAQLAALYSRKVGSRGNGRGFPATAVDSMILFICVLFVMELHPVCSAWMCVPWSFPFDACLAATWAKTMSWITEPKPASASSDRHLAAYKDFIKRHTLQSQAVLQPVPT